MKFIPTLIIFAIFTVFTSCEKDIKLEGKEYFVFGTYNGFCMGNCTAFFKVIDGKLFEDNMNTFVPGESLVFKETALSQSKYDIAYEAFEELPDDLLETMDKSFGCPGCVDQSVIYLQYFDGADLSEWKIDTDKDALPDYLKEYAEKIIKIVEELQK